MNNYKLVNNATGWLVGLIAAFVYISTMEPTASFWDCGEFIAVSYKLMVPHPPGAPLWLVIGRFFSFLAGNDLTKVAYWINMTSALSSAATIMFLFWSITLIIRRLLFGTNAKNVVASTSQLILIIGAALVGSLVYTFSDSFWFSAVEAEVYAMSSLFTAIAFWAILKWDAVADEEGSDRWILFVAYIIGLSIGVHLLSLLTVPSLAFIYYFRKYKTTPLGLFITFAAGFILIALIQSGIIPGLPTVAAAIDVFFVNSIGLPFTSGVLFFSILVIGGLVYGVIRSIKTNNHLLNLGLVSVLFILIGYTSYGVALIRANFKPIINENNPDNVINFVSYLKREQYGDRPIFRGPQYNAQPIEQKKGAPIYIEKDGKYAVADYKMENVYAEKDKTLFPRLYSQQPNHIKAYARWVDNLPLDPEKRPSFGNNMQYFFRYQLGHMYFRYLAWNFMGRESDIQDAGTVWPTQSRSQLPPTLAKNKGFNQYYMIPLILGLFGLYFQIVRNGKYALVIGMLFFTTGISLIIYANPPPSEPRERDYVFAGSFYAFAIWIAVGVVALADALKRFISDATFRNGLAAALCLIAPVLMAKENWDDHNRANRYHSVDSAKNLLNSCEKDAILFTGGDNDTFPLWYVQEVEGFRTDVRVCNLSLLGTDWYISQMKEQAHESAPLPITLTYERFMQGKNDYVPYLENPQIKGSLDLRAMMQAIQSEDPLIMRQAQNGSMLATLPTRSFYIPVDTNGVKAAGWVPAADAGRIAPRVNVNLNRSALYKNDLLMLDIIASNGFKRPIYFTTSLSNNSYMGLKEYMYLEGQTYRLMPVFNQGAQEGVVNTKVCYDNLMHKMFWRGLDDSTIYYDENYKRFPLSARLNYSRLASQLVAEGENDKAYEVIAHCNKVMPDAAVPYDPYSARFVPILYKLGKKDEAKKMEDIIIGRADAECAYYMKEPGKYVSEIRNNLFIYQELAVGLRDIGETERSNKYGALVQQYAPYAGFGTEANNDD